ncbi:hypothetical protein PSPO01_03346 [Paraphaeosphaeria sporulosa]
MTQDITSRPYHCHCLRHFIFRYILAPEELNPLLYKPQPKPTSTRRVRFTESSRRWYVNFESKNETVPGRK